MKGGRNMVQAPPKPKSKGNQHPVSKRRGSLPQGKAVRPLKDDVFEKSYVKIVLFIDKRDWQDLQAGNYEAWGDVVLRRSPLEDSVRVEVRIKKLPKGKAGKEANRE